LADSKIEIFNDKDKLRIVDLKNLSKTYLKNCDNIPGLERKISDEQLGTLVNLLDDNGIMLF